MTAAVPRFDPHDPALRSGNAAHGRLVFAAGNCAACHATPGQSDPLELGGGLALASPFGTFRVPNISSDATDGIGSWSVADLANALIAGVSPAGQHYYPAFPYSSYTGMRLEDVEDLYAYLKTLPAVSGRPPPHDLPPLFRFRRGLGLWKLLFFEDGRSEARLNGDPVHDRGAYLVETLGHCAECHSARNALGAIKPETRFAGGVDPEGTGFVPAATKAGSTSTKRDVFGRAFDILPTMPFGAPSPGQHEIKLCGERSEPVDDPLGFLGAQAIGFYEILPRIFRSGSLSVPVRICRRLRQAIRWLFEDRRDRIGCGRHCRM
nr:cytochrome c [Neorhizobium sp. BETTINA12A]